MAAFLGLEPLEHATALVGVVPAAETIAPDESEVTDEIPCLVATGFNSTAPIPQRPVGQVDKASASIAGDSRFESYSEVKWFDWCSTTGRKALLV